MDDTHFCAIFLFPIFIVCNFVSFSHKITKIMKKLNSILVLLWVAIAVIAAPFNREAYYSSANGKSGEALRQALAEILNQGRTVITYKGLWSAYETTDVREDGTIWDMYSSITAYNPQKDRAGNYKKEGDCYNREHTIPQSIFEKQSPMVSDIYQVYPTDGYVNNWRSSYCHGDVSANVKTKSAENFSKLGEPTAELKAAGCKENLVFEPADEYKGDFARTYFYFVTRYVNKMPSFKSYGMFTSNNLTDWAREMLLRWSTSDKVSTKETNRVEAAYELQHNRNPFIDYPGLEEYIWGAYKNIPFSASNYVSPYGTDIPTPTPTPEPTPNPDPTPDPDPVTPIVDEPTYDADVYVKVTTEPSDWSGTYLFVYESTTMALDGSLDKLDARNNGVSVTMEIDGSILVTTETEQYEFVISKMEDNTYSIKTSSDKYIGATKGKNSLLVGDEAMANTITLYPNTEDKLVDIICNNMYLRYNGSSEKRFRYYKESSSGMKQLVLYRKVKSTKGNEPTTEPDEPIVDIPTAVQPVNNSVQPAVIYDLSGRRLKEITKPGIYIVNGQKVMKF